MKKPAFNSLPIRVYLDPSFASHNDLSSQLGFIVILTDNFSRVNILHFKFYKSKRCTRRVLGNEIYEFTDSFEYAYMMKYKLENILRTHVPLQMLNDSRSIFYTPKKFDNYR